MSTELPPDCVSDDALLARVGTGDEAAFTALFQRRHSDVYRVALLMTGSPAAAEDVTQDVFLAVMSEAGRYETGRSSVRAWLCGIARNQARRRLERNVRSVPLSENDDSETPAVVVAVHPDPVGDIVNSQRVDALRRAIMNLPLRYREVVVLCDLEEITYADAAEALGCAVGTVRSRLHRARALLAAKMRAGLPSADPGRTRISRCLA
jgi:RNA polymerase sigma-70 factor (ECF subfamily)